MYPLEIFTSGWIIIKPGSRNCKRRYDDRRIRYDVNRKPSQVNAMETKRKQEELSQLTQPKYMNAKFMFHY